MIPSEVEQMAQEAERKEKGMGGRVERNGGVRSTTYLVRVHFEFAYNLDCNLVILAGDVLGAIDVAESAVSHLFSQVVSFQTGIPRHLPLLFSLFCNDLFDFCLMFSSVSVGNFLVLPLSVGSHSCGLSGVVSVVEIGGRVVPCHGKRLLW